MTRFQSLLLAGLLAFPAVALAQDFYEGPGPSNGFAATTGRVRGPITGIDYANGRMTIYGGGEAVVLRATPGQLSNYRRGEQVDLSYEKLGNSRWLSEGGYEGEISGFSRTATATGGVVGVDKADGYLTVMVGSQRQTFRAHPDLIRTVVPGQFLSVRYQRVSGRNWATEVSEGYLGEGGSG